jgi:signal transduction histidine kinase
MPLPDQLARPHLPALPPADRQECGVALARLEPGDPADETGPASTPPPVAETTGWVAPFRAPPRTFFDRFIPAACVDDPEAHRRARLISRFGFVGAAFGGAFAAFYFLIGHVWGAAIVAVCSLGFVGMPWVLRRTGRLNLAGNTLALILTLGFTALCGVEGGMYGHAIAWLATVPLCALLLVGRRSAAWWAVASFAAAGGVIAANLLGFDLGPAYEPAWHPLITAAGYASLIVFMFILGMIFETGRERAFGRMQDALKKLEASNEQLARLNEEKNEFLGIAAHDLKNPLTVIIGTADFLRGNTPPAQIPRLATSILSAGNRMLRLITDLLDANAIEQGKFTSNIERCDLRALVAECVENNRAAAARKQIALRVPAGPPVWARADRHAALQVLDNLLSNAIKYSPFSTEVEISAGTAADGAFIAVKDQGPGISTEDRKRMFGKFTRLTARPTGGESSSGLGLSIVKRLAEAMTGTVECASELGHGSTFTFRLPAWEE